jgi:hypothetical protein
MSLTALLFSAVGETRPYRQAGIHKVQVAEFYQCWCFSATGGEGDRPLSTARTGARPPLIPGKDTTLGSFQSSSQRRSSSFSKNLRLVSRRLKTGTGASKPSLTF